MKRAYNFQPGEEAQSREIYEGPESQRAQKFDNYYKTAPKLIDTHSAWKDWLLSLRTAEKTLKGLHN